jgi:hypothetical protein
MAFCALCTVELPSNHVRSAPFGKDEALVKVCDDCFDEHPRSGRYSFDSNETPRHTGNGNRRKGTPA